MSLQRNISFRRHKHLKGEISARRPQSRGTLKGGLHCAGRLIVKQARARVALFY